MHCEHWDLGTCHSCTWLPVPYPRQVADKESATRAALGHVLGTDTLEWLPTATSATTGMRTKAKLVVGGTPRRPTLGTLDEARHGVDLPGCPIQHPAINAAAPALKRFIRHLRLTPYDVPTRRGELKYIHISVGDDDRLMIRFVLRSSERLTELRTALPQLRGLIPNALVITANIHPRHEATVEGPEEILLTRASTLPTTVGGIRLELAPRAFSQTNTDVAGELYRQVARWALRPLAHTDASGDRANTLWDLYCGIGGFALHAAAAGIERVTGVELSPEAIGSARAAARKAGLSRKQADFIIGDATEWAVRQAPTHSPDVLVVNPPRRGIGPELAAWIDGCTSPRVLYSSCNPASLAKDVLAMPTLRAVQARLFDMFPHTAHAEVAVLLERRP